MCHHQLIKLSDERGASAQSQSCCKGMDVSVRAVTVCQVTLPVALMCLVSKLCVSHDNTI